MNENKHSSVVYLSLQDELRMVEQLKWSDKSKLLALEIGKGGGWGVSGYDNLSTG